MDMRVGISLIYSALAEPVEKATYMLRWERDLDIKWGLEVWHSHISSAYKGMLNISLMEDNLKVMSRWYLAPKRLAKYYPQSLPFCFRGCGHLGTVLHTWWEIRGYWDKVFHLIQRTTGIVVNQDPAIALLNHKTPTTPKNTQILIHFILLGAKITMAGVWKSPSVSFFATKQKILWIMTQERISNTILNSTMEKFKCIGDPWARYIGVSL